MKQGSPQIGRRSTRRDFLKQSAMLFGAAALAQRCLSAPRQSGEAGDDPIANALAAGLGQQPILVVLNAGITAPNPHNTQAWKFRQLSPTEALLYVDESRTLPVTDPGFRQIHMGQGALLELCAIAATRLQMKAEIELFPEGYRLPESIGRKPVARLRLLSGGPQSPLAAFIAQRHTVRAAFHGPWISQQEYQELARLAAPRISLLSSVKDESELEGHLQRHMAGFELESSRRRTADESRRWLRIGDQENQTLRDGISLAGNGISGLRRFVAETFFLSREPESYYEPSGQRQFLEIYRQNLFSVRGHTLLITPGNDVRSWVLCGGDYLRYQLAAASLGLVMRPMSQLMQEFEEMRPLREEYDRWNKIRSPAKIQISALLGRSDYDFYAPRRPLQSMLLSA
ncbi:MAG: twin-arginine translocation signal domain-containing protein [Leptospirales bacterium]|nr:twin-arginine translocation signal domain-containing protein [Leptospirales bacterium]